MFIYYELQGTQLLHKGMFDTNGFWVKYGVDRDDVTHELTNFKLWSHFSFTYESTDKSYTDKVFNGLLRALSGSNWEHPSIGYIKLID
jgi:hypothetical protein